MIDCNFCDYRTVHVGLCMVAVYDGSNRCDRHKDKKSNVKKVTKKKFSGYSIHREMTGEFQ